jgi:hydrogenase expression/formation protein HypE
MKDDTIVLAHGGGGTRTSDLIQDVFLRYFTHTGLRELQDATILPIKGSQLAFTTDSYVVHPLEFPGGDIGKLAVSGTVNDLAVMGAIPHYLSCGFIIEEGLSFRVLERIVRSMATEAERAGVSIVTGDTKVVEHGKGDGVFINTAGVGIRDPQISWHSKHIQLGDQVLCTSTLGDHALTIFTQREHMPIQTTLQSDVAPLNHMIARLHPLADSIRVMRDITRGGLGNILHELLESTSCGVSIQEESLPISPGVHHVCEIVGMDPIYLANEGNVVMVVDPHRCEEVLRLIQADPLGKDARVIGTIIERPPGTVIMETAWGTHRMITKISGEQLPRIC